MGTSGSMELKAHLTAEGRLPCCHTFRGHLGSAGSGYLFAWIPLCQFYDEFSLEWEEELL